LVEKIFDIRSVVLSLTYKLSRLNMFRSHTIHIMYISTCNKYCCCC